MQVLIHTFDGERHQVEISNDVIDGNSDVATKVVKKICKRIGVKFHAVKELTTTDTDEYLEEFNYN